MLNIKKINMFIIELFSPRRLYIYLLLFGLHNLHRIYLFRTICVFPTLLMDVFFNIIYMHCYIMRNKTEIAVF